MKEKKMPVHELEKIIGIRFKDPGLLKKAFVHRSYLNEHKTLNLESNEKLEFLGDSVLSLITSDTLFKTYPRLHEGEYTNIKAKMVRTESLAEAARALNLARFLLLSKGEEGEDGRNNSSILADCFEALVGAIFLESGLQEAGKFIEKYLFKDKLETVVQRGLYSSVKNELQEYLQENYRVLPEYVVVAESGPEHEKSYTVGVYFRKKLLAKGLGKSKKQAQEQAALLALQKIKLV